MLAFQERKEVTVKGPECGEAYPFDIPVWSLAGKGHSEMIILLTPVGLLDLFPTEKTRVLLFYFRDTRKRGNGETCIQFCHQPKGKDPDGDRR